MSGRKNALRLSGVSGLAIAAGLLVAPSQSFACDFTIGANPVVTVLCGAPNSEIPVLPFDTSYTYNGDLLYDGNRSDLLNMSGGSIVSTAATGPFGVDPIGSLGPSTGEVNMLGGDDLVIISGGVIGAIGAPIDVALGAGNDRFNMVGGVLFGSALGGDGNDTFNLTGGTIDGAVYGNAGDDIVTIGAGAVINGNTANPALTDAVGLGTGADQFTMNGGTVGADVSGNEDNDTLTLNDGDIAGDLLGNEGNDAITVAGGSVGEEVRGNEGDDQITISGGAIAQNVLGDDGVDTIDVSGGGITGNVGGGDDNDTLTVSGGTVGGSVTGDTGNDNVTISGTAQIAQNVDGGDGDDALTVSGGTITGWLYGGLGTDTIAVSGGVINQSIYAGAGNDSVTISGTASVVAAGGNDSVALQDGDDTFTMTGGTVATIVSGGAGNDTFAISGGTAGIINANEGDDRIDISGGTVSNLLAGNGVDTITVKGGAITQDVSGDGGADQITVSAGTVGGSVFGGNDDDNIGISGGTITGNVDGGAGDDAVAVSGGAIQGDIVSESVTLTGGAINGNISGITGNTLVIQDAGTLDLQDGVTFAGTGAANGRIVDTDLANGGAESQIFNGFNSLGVFGSQLSFAGANIGIAQLNLSDGSSLFVDGATNLTGALSLANSTIDMLDGAAGDVFTLGGLALDQSEIRLDLDQNTEQADRIVATNFSATGANTIVVNLVGPANFAAPTDIVIIDSTNTFAGTFGITTIPGTTGSLFTYELLPGAGGGLILRASPANFGVAGIPRNVIDGSTVDTAVDALYGIIDDAIHADLGLGNGRGAAPVSDTFGVFASGQLAHVEHDGYTVTNGPLVGQGPSFDADEFSAAISLDFNAAKHFGFDDKYGLNIGVFAGYASSDIDLGAFQDFIDVGDASNESGMFGAYGLFRQGTTYGLLAFSGFLGNTDVTNGVLASTGEYDTEGYAVAASVGRIFALSDRVRFDLRGGITGVTFSGDSYTDSAGNLFGKSHVSFGAVKFEPGIYADYQMGNGMTFSPYARAELQQRFDYENTSSLDTRKLSFDDADFSGAVSTGFNLKMTQRSTLSGEVRGKFSEDSTTIAGKLGLKIGF